MIRKQTGCVLACWLSLFGLISIGPTPVSAVDGPTGCRAENAIFEASRSQRDDFEPDTLRFDYEAKQGGIGPWPGWPKQAVIHSAQRKRDFVFDTYFTNNSGKEGIGLGIPLKELDETLRITQKPLFIESDVYSIWPDLALGFLPLKGMEAPRLILLPGFRHLAHASYSETISSGIARSTFRFASCEGGAAPDPIPQQDEPSRVFLLPGPDKHIATDQEITSILGGRAWPYKAKPRGQLPAE